MRVTQGTFSFLPDLTDEEIEKQITFSLEHGYAIMVEYTDDAHPRNSYWDMWKQPDFDLDPSDSGEAMEAVHKCREAYPNHYIKLVAYDSSLGRQSARLSFIVNRPQQEPGFYLERQETADRQINYTIKAYAHQDAVGRRYGNEGDLATTRDPASVQDATPGRDSPIAADREGGEGSAPYEGVAPEKDEGVGES